jgi:hypothetical protein
MSVQAHLSLALWEVQGQAVYVFRASDLAPKGRNRQGFLRAVLSGTLGRLSSFVLILEDLDSPDTLGRPSFSLGVSDAMRGSIDFSARAVREGSAALAFAAAAAAEFAQITSKACAEIVLLNSQEVFRIQNAAGKVCTTRLSARTTAGVSKLLPTLAPRHRLSSGIDVTLVDAGQMILLLRADAIGATGREQPGKRFKNNWNSQQWDELYDEVSGLLDPNDELEVRLLGLERARELPLVWVSPPVGDNSDMDCSIRFSPDGRTVAPISGPAQLSVVAAAAVPGTILQQITRTLPGLDCRLGLGTDVLVASADAVVFAGGQARLQALTMHQSVRCLLRGQHPA